MRSAVAALCVLLAGRAAAAQELPLQEAFEQGLAAFQRRDYETALRRFQRAYDVSRSPEFLFNLGLTLERLDRRDEAVAALQRYLALEPSSPQRPVVERHLATLRAAPPPPAAPPPAAPPAAAPPPAAPPAARPTPHPPIAPAAPRPVWPWIALGAGAASGIAGAVLLAAATDPGRDPALLTEAAYLDAAGSVDSRRVAGAVLLGVGGAALATAVVGLVLARPAREAPRVGVAPVVGGAVVGLTLRGM